MAGDWIAMRVDLADDPAVIQIAAMLGIDEYGVIGRLLKVWSWANSQTTDGNAFVTLEALQMKRFCNADVTLLKRSGNDSVTENNENCNAASVLCAFVDRQVSTPGFAKSMISAGWLVENERGITFPRFDRWNLQTGKQRLLASKRVAKHRSENKPAKVRKKVKRKCNGPSVTKALPQNRTEQNSKEEEPPTPLQGDVLQIPIELDTPEFRQLWAEWKAERRSRKVKPYTPTGEAQQLAALASFGLAEAMESIRESLRQGWQGLFKPKKTAERANSDEKVMRQIMEGLQQP